MVYFKCYNEILSDKVKILKKSSFIDIREKMKDLILYIEFYANKTFRMINSEEVIYRDILDIIDAINLVVSNFYFKNKMMNSYYCNKLIDILLNICLNKNIELKILKGNMYNIKNENGGVLTYLNISLLFNYNKESIAVCSYNINFYKIFLSSYIEKINNEKIIQDIFKFIM